MGMARSLTGQALVAQQARDYGRATSLYGEVLRLAADLGDTYMLAYCLYQAAVIACDSAQPERAARLFGAAGALRRAGSAALSPGEQTEYGGHLDDLRLALGDVTFNTVTAQGEALTLEEAMAYALGSG